MTYLSSIDPEQALLVLLSSPFWSDRHEQILYRLRKEVSSETLSTWLPQLLANGTAGFVYQNTKGRSILPKQLLADLKDIYQTTAVKNLQKLKSTLKLLETLSGNRIPAMPLKGAAAGDFIFKDTGVYPFGDIDILVPMDKLEETCSILLSRHGFETVDEIAESDLMQSHYHLNLTKHGLLYEIHWNLVKRYFHIAPDYWWERAGSMEWDGVECMDLHPEDHILYLIFRLYDHGFYPLRFFVLLAGLIRRKSGEISWEQLNRQAEQFHMRKLVSFVLQLCDQMFLLDIPAGPWNTRIPGARILENKILSGLFNTQSTQHRQMLLYALFLMPPGSLAGILLQRVFPSPSELRLRYNIPVGSARLYLYYLLNPVLLLFKKK